MATVTISPARTMTATVRDDLRNLPLACAAVLAVILIAGLAVTGYPYYRLATEDRPFSPLHPLFRSSGIIGLKLGILGVALFFVLFLYPLRKRWRWLATIGNTRRWLNAHSLVGMTAPLVITLHTSLHWHGLAGLAYWIMVTVALSGFIGRYLYAKIPRKLSAVKLTDAELESETTSLASQLDSQGRFTQADFQPLFNLPSSAEIRAMNSFRALLLLLRLDLFRPVLAGRLRRRVMSRAESFRSLGGLLPSTHRDVEEIVDGARRLSRLRAATAFLHRTERVFHLWHVIHRPFSLSFVVLVVVHVTVALSVGVR